MSRQAIAYLLIALMVLALAAVVAWRVYYARDRRLGRRKNRDRAAREARRRRFGDG